MTPKEEKISGDAVRYIKQNKKYLYERFANPHAFNIPENPISIFMAGSPGAGKTEFSQNLVNENVYIDKPVRIDADEI